MLSYDLKFLTTDESVNLNNVDFKTSKYETKKKVDETLYDRGKRNYCERRGGQWRFPRPRLLKEFENKLRDTHIVYCEWMNETLIILVFSSGCIAYLTVKASTLDITQILFDRYCVGKLSGQTVTGVVFTETHILFMHAESTATLITFGIVKALSNGPCRIADRNPLVQSVEVGRGGAVSGRGARVLVRAPPARPAPWSPTSDHHHDLLLYNIHGQHMNIIAYHQLETETLSAELSTLKETDIHIVEQTVYHKSGVSVEWSRYSVSSSEEGVARLSSRRVSLARASLPAAARALARDHDEIRLLVACIDGTLHIIHHSAGLTKSIRIGFIPSGVCWAGGWWAWGGTRVWGGDAALQPLAAAGAVTLQHHQRKESPMRVLSSRACAGGALLLLWWGGGGPLALARFTHPELPLGWLRLGRVSRALAYLKALDWDREPHRCLNALQTIFAWCGRGALGAAQCAALEGALAACLRPGASPPAAVADLARAFHHQLLRRGRWGAAGRLAAELRSWELAADARWAAARAHRTRHERDARALLRDLDTESECSTSCSCSESSCSHSDEERGARPPPLPRVLPPKVMPVTVNHNKMAAPSTNSIRPNLHQYVERDLTIWNTEVVDNKMAAKSTLKWRSLDMLDDETEARNSWILRPSGSAPGHPAPPRAKNVKFADTVSVAVVSEPASPEEQRPLMTSDHATDLDYVEV